MTICNHPGCSELVTSGYCDRHKKEKRNYDKQRGTASQRGYDSRWRRERLAFLKQNPLCVHCEQEGTVKAAKEVDHIVPHKGDMVLFWDKNNWQSLCKRHHSVKTAKEDGGFGR